MVALAIPAELVAQEVVVAALFAKAALLTMAEAEPAELVALAPVEELLAELVALVPVEEVLAELVALLPVEEAGLALPVVRVREQLMAA